MKTTISRISLFLMITGILFQACQSGGEETGHSQTENITISGCRIAKIEDHFNSFDKITEFKYTGDQIKSTVNSMSAGGLKTMVKYTFDGERLSSLEEINTKNVFTYVYQNDQLEKITGTENLFDREFEYDSQNRIVKETTTNQGKIVNSIKYTYDSKGVPKTAEIFDEKGVAKQIQTFTFDDKLNPYVRAGAFLNNYELLYGYPIGNCIHNLKQVDMKFLIDNEGKIGGDKIEAGGTKTMKFDLEYNKQGFPVKIKNDVFDRIIEYQCN